MHPALFFKDNYSVAGQKVNKQELKTPQVKQ